MIRRFLLVCGFITSMAAVGLALNYAYPPDLHRYEDLSRAVVAADGSILRVFTSDDDMWRLPTRLEDVDPRYIELLVSYEDKRFWSHYGVDPLAVIRAMGQWVSAGKIVSGASTITMQVARLLEPRPRTFLSKITEMARAVQLEMRFSKREILSIYLTLAPFGGNIEGVRAASLTFFNKPPQKLTTAEAALLVALPQSPSVLRPDRNRKNAIVARKKVLGRLQKTGALTSIEIEEADNTPIESKRYQFPFLAPHLARRLFTRNPSEETIRTHIVPDFQISAADIVGEMVRRADPGVNAAAIIVENKTANVLAYVASNGFFDASRSGQVDYIQAIRSPGSALKPFIYAMAFDDGVAHPETFLADRKKRFGGYRPTNFNGLSHGLITARFALQASLNIPAVTLLNEVGPRRFLSRLENVGLHPRLGNVESSPGLALALGGVGVSLEQLITIYSALARSGKFKKLSFIKDKKSAESVPFFDQKTASSVASILRDTPRPAGRYDEGRYRKIAFKTGTSSGYRDVLALGFDDTYTVGVWMGHPEAKPMTGKTGIRTAAPTLFRIFDFLPIRLEGKATSLANVGITINKAPRNLRVLFNPAGPQSSSNPRQFSISFPVDGAKIPLRRRNSSSTRVYPIKLRDGKRPFSVFVNGKPNRLRNLARTVSWSPKEPGFYSIMAIDREGNIAASNVEVLEK
jgi:penicillin-binding protein 1C